jgi:hypothetical protein
MITRKIRLVCYVNGRSITGKWFDGPSRKRHEHHR